VGSSLNWPTKPHPILPGVPEEGKRATSSAMRWASLIKLKLLAMMVWLIAVGSAARADDTVTLKSADGQYQIVLPAGWASADFQVDNVRRSARVIKNSRIRRVVAEL